MARLLVIRIVCGLACAAAYTTPTKYVSALVSGADPESCKVLPGATTPDSWCQTNCGTSPPNCPSTLCSCEGGLPSPSPVQSMAQKQLQENEDRVTKANQEREEAEAERAKEEKDRLDAEAQRIAEADEAREAADAAARAKDPTASPSPDPVFKSRVRSKLVSALVGGADPSTCVSVSGADAATTWCKTSCANTPPDCPSTLCKCGDDSDSPSSLAPSPEPTAGRPLTTEEKAAKDALAEREAASAKADQEREAAEKARLDAEAERMAKVDEEREKRETEVDKAREAKEATKTQEEADREAARAADAAKLHPSPSPQPTRHAHTRFSKRVSALLAGEDPSTCKSLSGTVSDTEWCIQSCSAPQPNCPSTMCVCEGATASPSPGSMPVAPSDDARPLTESEKEAADALQEREAAVRKADQEREAAEKERADEEKARMEEDEKRVAELEKEREAKEDQADKYRESRDTDIEKRDSARPSPSPHAHVRFSKYISALVAGDDPASCEAISGAEADNKWCATNCAFTPPACPSSMCICKGAAASPSPIAAAVPPEPIAAASPRAMTAAEKEAKKQLEEREAVRAAAEKEREDAEKERMGAQEERRAEAEKMTNETAASRDAQLGEIWEKNDKERRKHENEREAAAKAAQASPSPAAR